jgi:hypothetical protein
MRLIPVDHRYRREVGCSSAGRVRLAVLAALVGTLTMGAHQRASGQAPSRDSLPVGLDTLPARVLFRMPSGQHPCAESPIDCDGTLHVYFEEDNLQSTPSTDRNYTMGLGFGRSTNLIREQGHARPLDWAERFLSHYTVEALFGLPSIRSQISKTAPADYYSEMLSGTAFTPQNLRATGVIVGDRPYAFLLGWTVTRVSVNTDNTESFSSELTLGTIGSRLGRNVQRYIHQSVRPVPNCDPRDLAHTGPCDPKGWDNQIMDVPSLWIGIPTLRYGLTVERAKALSPWWQGSKGFEIVGSAGGELGYYTSAWGGVRSRIGFFDSQFFTWKEAPLSNVSRVPQLSVQSARIPPPFELFAFGGIRPRAIAYNALLQGYPGYKGYAFSAAQVRHTQLEGEAGASVLIRFGQNRTRGVRVTKVWNAFRTSEFDSPFARTHQWGGYYISTPSAWYPRLTNLLQM